jgi:vacuolar-type H+-ATPase subunit H
MPGEGQLDRRGVDADSAARPVLDEDRLAEAQPRRDALALPPGDIRAVEEHAERVAPLAVLADEDAQNVKIGHRSILGRSWSATPVDAKIDLWVSVDETRGVDVLEEGLKGKGLRRAPAALAVLAIAATGVAWSGCGGGGDNSTSEAQEQVEKGLEEAKQGLEKGKEETKKGLEKAQKETKQGVSQGSETAQKAIEKAKEEATQGIEKGKEEAQRGIEEAEKYAP